MPEGHEDHSVLGMLQDDGTVKPVYCETCYTMWQYA